MKKFINENTLQNIIALSISGIIILAFYFIVNNLGIISSAFSELLEVLLPFIFGFSLAFIFSPLMNRINKLLQSKTKLSQKHINIVSAFSTLVIMILMLVLFFVTIVPSLIDSIIVLSSQLPGYVDTAQTYILDFFERYQIDQRIVDQIVSSSEGFINSLVNVVLEYIPKILNTSILITTRIFNFIVGLIIALYILLDKQRFSLQFKKITYAVFSRKIADELVIFSRTSSKIFNSFIIGKAIDSFIIGIICYVGMLVLKLPFALLISVIIGITNMIPVFGPFIGAIPGALILLMIKPIYFVWFVLFILVLQQFDGNILGPKILGDSLGLSSIWIMFAIIVGGGFFGIIGMFIGVPLFAVFYTYIKQITERRLKKKNISIEELKDI